MDLTGIGGLIILIADIYAIVMILQSSADSSEKIDLVLGGVNPASDRPDYLVFSGAR